jgi:ATP-dependent Clp protease protease subunit
VPAVPKNKITQPMNSNIDKNEFRKYAVKHHRINSTYVDKFIGGVDRSMPSGIVNRANRL